MVDKSADFENKISFLMKECQVDRGMALVALNHSRGSISYAKDFLCSETSRHIYGREAREYDLND